jgi:hypothetical protein
MILGQILTLWNLLLDVSYKIACGKDTPNICRVQMQIRNSAELKK